MNQGVEPQPPTKPGAEPRGADSPKSPRTEPGVTRLTSSAGSNESGIDPGSSIESDDIQLVEDVLKGRVDSFRILVERYQNHVFRLALKLSNGDRERAADLAQETFLRAYRGLAGFAFDAKFSTWLHRVTLNVAISQKRRERAQKRGTALSLDVPVDEQSEEPRQVAARTRTPQQEVVASEGMRRVYEAVNSLDEDLKRLVILVNMEDYSYEDAAMMLNIPIGTVRSRLHRARELLMQKLRGTNRGR